MTTLYITSLNLCIYITESITHIHAYDYRHDRSSLNLFTSICKKYVYTCISLLNMFFSELFVCMPIYSHWICFLRISFTYDCVIYLNIIIYEKYWYNSEWLRLTVLITIRVSWRISLNFYSNCYSFHFTVLNAMTSLNMKMTKKISFFNGVHIFEILCYFTYFVLTRKLCQVSSCSLDIT